MKWLWRLPACFAVGFTGGWALDQIRAFLG